MQRILTALVALMTACSPQQRQQDVQRFVASTTGSVFYPVACSAAGDLSPANRVYFGSEEDARAAGYRRTTNRACAGMFAAAPRDTMSGRTPPALDGGTCVVQRVIDGDTFACADRRRVRLLLIDAPELDQAPYGYSARRQLASLLLLDSRVRLELDVDWQDRYGRTLAYVHLDDGRMVNVEMVRSGYALVSVYPPNVQYVERMRAAADSARAARRGLWSTSAFECRPADYRAGRCR